MAVAPELDEAPGWLVTLLQKPKHDTPPPAPVPQLPGTAASRLRARLASPDGSVDENFARSVLDRAAAEMRSKGPESHERNDTLNRLAYDLFGLAKGGRLNRDAVILTLTTAAAASGLKPKEIEATLESAESSAEAKQGAPLQHAAAGTRPQAPAERLAATIAPDPAPAATQGDGVAPSPGLDLEDQLEGSGRIGRLFSRVRLDIRATVPDTPLLLPWLYGDGCFTVLQSEPGLGKSWLALWAAVQLVNAGQVVVYLDEEGGPSLVHERLQLLGADPEMVDRCFFLYCFEARSWGEEDRNALRAMLEEAAETGPPVLAVLDSLPDFLAVAGLSEDKAQDVTTFMHAVAGTFRQAGVATLLLDHLVKPQSGSGRSRYARGSGSKLAKSDATILLEAPVPFDVDTTGLLSIWKTKDRRGRLPIPNLGGDGLTIQVKPEDERLLFEIKDAVARGGHMVNSERDMAARILRLFREDTGAGAWMSKRDIVTALRAGGQGTRKETVWEALDALVTAGALLFREAGQSHMYSMPMAVHEVMKGDEGA